MSMTAEIRSAVEDVELCNDMEKDAASDAAKDAATLEFRRRFGCAS